MKLTTSILAVVLATALSAACGKSTRRTEGALGGAGGGTSGAAGLGPAGAGLLGGAGVPDDGESGQGGAVSGGTTGEGGGADASTTGTGGTAFAGRTGANGGTSLGGATSSGGSSGVTASGGSSLGGATAGDSANAGASAAGAPAIAVPDGCVPAEQHVGGAFCSSDMTCGGPHFIVSCNPTTTADPNMPGPWRCICTQGSSSAEFDFPKVTGTRTCEVAAEACFHPELLTGDATCSLNATTNGNTCTAVDTCTTEHEVDGAELTTSTAWSGSCSSEDTTAICSCPGVPANQYTLEQSDVASGCDLLEPLCTGAAPTPLDAWSCDTGSEQADPSYGCQTIHSCTQPLQLNDGSAVTQVADFNVICEENSDNTQSECECRNSEISLTLVSDIPASDIGACRVANGACVGTAPLTLSGTPDCTTSNVQASDDQCTQALDCSQDATAGSQAVMVLTSIDTSCDLQDDGSWFCTCTNAGTSLTLTARSGTQACTQAIAQCPAVPTHFF